MAAAPPHPATTVLPSATGQRSPAADLTRLAQSPDAMWRPNENPGSCRGSDDAKMAIPSVSATVEPQAEQANPPGAAASRPWQAGQCKLSVSVMAGGGRH
jgi:hypothetical protein